MGQIKVEKNVGGIEGLCFIPPAVHGDNRGYFMETYSQRDMAEAGLPEPEYKQSEFMLYATLKNKNWGKENSSWGDADPDVSHVFAEGAKKGAKKSAKSKEIEQRVEAVYTEICKNPSVKNIELESLVGATKHQIETALKSLQKTGRIHREDSNRKGRWIID